MRSLIASLRGDGKPVPKDLLQGVDGMSLQIAKHQMERKDYGEAQKWLENVSYDEDSLAQAKYLLAQLAYQKREYGQVLFLLQDDLVAKTPDSDAKWGMCMLAGFSWRDCRMPDLEKAKEFLKKVPASFSGYAQAQHGLGDIYRDQKDPDRAEPHYLQSVKNPKYAPEALFLLAQIYKDRADATKPKTDEEKKARELLLRKAGVFVQELMVKYPLTDVAKQAKAMVAALQAQGVAIEAEVTEEEKIAAWEKAAREKSGTSEAAQALLSLAQHHSRTVADPKTRAVIRAPNWSACADACRPIIASAQPFADVSAERWQELSARARYYLGRAELGSLPPGASAKRLQRTAVEPVRIPAGGSAARAIEHFREAQRLTPEKQQPDFHRELEYSILEAMLKAEDRAVREEGEKRYAELETKYGSDPNYQRLAIVTADWLDDHGQHDVAGRTYRAIARKANLDREEVLHLLHLAGVSYGKAGRAMLESGSQSANLAFLVQPRAAIRTTVSIFRAFAPFQNVKRIVWEREGPDPTAAEVLARVSREFGVPFVWNPDPVEGSVDDYLKRKTIPRATLGEWREPRSLERYYTWLVDTNRFAVDFDLGASGGAPTLAAKNGEGEQDVKALEIYDPSRPRFPALARPYGAFAETHRGPAMLFTIAKRIEEVTGARIVWSEGIQKDEALSREFRELPGVANNASVSCEEALRVVLEAVGLRYEVIRRDRSREMLIESNDCFDELRRFGADSTYAEDAMFNIAVNLYAMKEYGKMKLLLREYLKTFDSPSFAHHYDACFWLGRLFEIDRNFRDAVKHYSLAAEERVVLFRPKSGTPAPTLDELKARLSYETLFNLSRKGSGSFKDTKLEAFLSFIRFNTNVEIALDPSARGLESALNRNSFMGVPCLDLLHGAMVDLGLDLRTENGDPDVAEKAYYRIALVYKEDNLMREALEYVNTMLTRFPKSARRPDALKLKLDIFKGLKDYSSVLATIEELKAAAKGKIEAFRLDYEMGRIYFDLCDYAAAEQNFSLALSGTQDRDEWLKIREALAVTYLRMTNRWSDALSTYRNITQYENSPVRQSVDALMIWFLECVTAQPPAKKPLPEKEAEFMKMYTALSDKERGDMGPNEIARATWVYYAAGLVDLLVDTNSVAALEKFDAAAASPDGFLSGEALYEAARIHVSRGRFGKARNTLEHLLFTTKAVEPLVKATYLLSQCLKSSGEYDGAFRRLTDLVTRFPISPYAEMARQDSLYIERTPKPAESGAAAVPGVPAAGGTSTGAVAGAAAPAQSADQGAALIALGEGTRTGVTSRAAVTNAGGGARK
jgi:tetratricopeptide (TPR) repeat protein